MDFPVYIQGFQKISKIFSSPTARNLKPSWGLWELQKKLDSIRVAYVSEADKFQILRAI